MKIKVKEPVITKAITTATSLSRVVSVLSIHPSLSGCHSGRNVHSSLFDFSVDNIASVRKVAEYMNSYSGGLSTWKLWKAQGWKGAEQELGFPQRLPDRRGRRQAMLESGHKFYGLLVPGSGDFWPTCLSINLLLIFWPWEGPFSLPAEQE